MKHHAHDMHDTPERELPLKDAAIVLLGTIAAVLVIALLTGWMLDQANINVKRATSMTSPPVVMEQQVAVSPQPVASGFTRIIS